ncbi:hypothetical protein [Priestia aryabhattai]|uniref:hypothetical protein n=1 Tax=Priestia aryabhattai TaxID=412384 RepID=UPI003CF221A3
MKKKKKKGDAEVNATQIRGQEKNQVKENRKKEVLASYAKLKNRNGKALERLSKN